MTPHRARFAAARTGALGALGLLALLAACETKLPTETEVANMNVAAAEQGARRMALLMPDDSGASYTLDGRAITAAEAHALRPEAIGQIRVMRKRTPTGPEGGPVIDIVSRKPGDVLVAGVAPRTETRVFVRELKDSASAARIGLDAGHDEARRTFDGLLIVDGARAEPGRLRTIGPDQIVSIEVLKGPAAAKQYTDPVAARGVIRVTTKAGAAK